MTTVEVVEVKPSPAQEKPKKERKKREPSAENSAEKKSKISAPSEASEGCRLFTVAELSAAASCAGSVAYGLIKFLDSQGACKKVGSLKRNAKKGKGEYVYEVNLEKATASLALLWKVNHVA